MTPDPYPLYLQRMAMFVAWRLENGYTDEQQAIAKLKADYPSLTEAQYQEALRYGRVAFAAGTNLEILSEGSKLSDALLGEPEPFPDVQVYGLAVLKDANDGTHYRTVALNLPWSTTVAEALHALGDEADAVMPKYGMKVESVSFTGPLLFPRERNQTV